MEIHLLTHDPQLIATVRQVVPGVTVLREFDSSAGRHDIDIWDLDACPEIANDFVNRHKRECPLLVVASSDTLASMDEGALLRCCPLLKPVSSLTMRAFLDLASNGCDWRGQALRADQLSSDRDALLEYALASNLRLQQYDHQRTNFLSRALHDMRAPLTALHGYCGLLADGQVGAVTPEQRELLMRMQASTRRLSKQAAGMFELSVLGHVRRKPHLVPADIEDVVAQAVHDALLLAHEKDIDLSTALAPPGEMLFFEPEQMTQVFLNILENCCRFTPNGGSIEVRGYNVQWDFEHHCAVETLSLAGANADAYRIDIEDNGSGIQPDLLCTIFEEYTSYSGGRDRSGGGLGLAICKMIVNAHQGSIFAGNGDTGARFSVVLPFQPVILRSYAETEIASQWQLQA